MTDHEGDEQKAELLVEHADVAEAIPAEVEQIAIDAPTSHVNVVSVDAGEPVAVAVAPHDSAAIHVSVDAAGFGNGSSTSNHSDANASAYLLHSILQGNWPAVIERCGTHPEEIGTALEIAVNRDVPTSVLRAVARAGDASVITSPNEDGIAPIQTIMYKCHDFRNVEHVFEYEERLHRAFLLVAVALGRNVDAEVWNYDGVTTSVSLLDLLSFRRKFGSEFVVGGLIWFLMDAILTSPVDPDGNTPLHIEAAVSQRPSRGEIKLRPLGVEERTKNHLRDVLTSLIEAFPTNIATSNNAGELPFDVIIKSDRGWESGIAILVERHPEALLAWLERQEFSELLLPALLQKITQYCGVATALHILQNLPKCVDYHGPKVDVPLVRSYYKSM